MTKVAGGANGGGGGVQKKALARIGCGDWKGRDEGQKLACTEKKMGRIGCSMRVTMPA
jgi:hypothetical protein